MKHNQVIEVLRDNFTPAQVLQIRHEAHQKGQRVFVNRLYSRLVEIEIIEPRRAIDVTPKNYQLRNQL